MQHLGPQDRQQLEAIFKRFDNNGDGCITVREFQSACRQFNSKLTSYDIDQLAREMDIDGNGMIDLEEFCLCMAKHVAGRTQQRQQQRPSLSQRQLRDAFNFFDKDKSGNISQTELRQVMQSLNVRCSEPEFKAMLESIDTNGDGQIDFDEFSTLLNSLF